LPASSLLVIRMQLQSKTFLEALLLSIVLDSTFALPFSIPGLTRPCVRKQGIYPRMHILHYKQILNLYASFICCFCRFFRFLSRPLADGSAESSFFSKAVYKPGKRKRLREGKKIWHRADADINSIMPQLS
jgi:hypothetical protein